MISRNEPCWCGSGKKYKFCHQQTDEKLNELSLSGYVIPNKDHIKSEADIEGMKKKCCDYQRHS